MADRVWEAGLQLFVEIGAYCQTTERCIRFTKDEVLDILGQVRDEITLGIGKDAVVMRHRGVEDAATRRSCTPARPDCPAARRIIR